MSPAGGATGERGSASVWVLACCALLMAVAYAGTLRASAVLARHRAESAADLAALAAAGQIGLSGQSCPAARSIAQANGAELLGCTPSLVAGGRSGMVLVRLRLAVRLPVLGARAVIATARAARDPVPP